MAKYWLFIWELISIPYECQESPDVIPHGIRTAVTENYRSQPATQTVLWMHVMASKKVIFSEKSLKKKWRTCRCKDKWAGSYELCYKPWSTYLCVFTKWLPDAEAWVNAWGWHPLLPDLPCKAHSLRHTLPKETAGKDRSMMELNHQTVDTHEEMLSSIICPVQVKSEWSYILQTGYLEV